MVIIAIKSREKKFMTVGEEGPSGISKPQYFDWLFCSLIESYPRPN